MRQSLRLFIKTALISLTIHATTPSAVASTVSVVVSVPEQRLYLFDETGKNTASYRVSTSKFGVGDHRGSYETPLGQFAIAGKVGTGAAPGTVFKGCHQTGEVVHANSRGRDPIVTRVLPLRGLEKGNASAYARRIYIHGTPEESRIGRPVSYGCIRMRSRDVIDLFDEVNVGTHVEITQERLSRGLFASVTRPPVIAESPAMKTAEMPVKAVASVKIKDQPKFTTVTTTRDDTTAKPARDAAKLLNVSGLSINFGNITDPPDAPR